MKYKLNKIGLLILACFLVACSTNDKTTSNKENDEQVDIHNQSENVYEIRNQNEEKIEKNFVINIEEVSFTLDGKDMVRYVYTDETKENYTAGKPIVVNEGDRISFDIYNNTSTSTNIHWHGMSVPNDQDGPGILIEEGGTHHYEFLAEQAGTYWYHSHERPVRDQVDEGMYGAIIVKAKEDKQYDQDHIFLLDDWVVNRNTAHMKVVGDVDVINGYSDEEIVPLRIQTGELVKARFINASTARVQELNFPFDVRVTHTDGRAVSNAYMTSSLSIAPGERYDVEIAYTGTEDEVFHITNDRDNGMILPIEYTASNHATTISPFVERDFSEVSSEDMNRKEDILMVMSDSMGRGGHKWTINGEVYEESDGFELDRNTTYKIRFENDGMHSSDHPMHIHGAHFRVININGTPIEDEIWKDTVNVKPDEYVEVLISFDKQGVWMAHCHILDHEDGGMMTHLFVK